MTKLLTYNVNGIRAAARKGLVEWIQASDADVVALQEIKSDADQFDWENSVELVMNPIFILLKKRGIQAWPFSRALNPNKSFMVVGTDGLMKRVG